MLTAQEIREIIKLIDQSSITEFSYEADGAAVTLKKGTNTVIPVSANPTQVVNETQTPPQVQENIAPVEEQKNENVETVTQDEPETTNEIPNYDYEVASPMVGTFYAASSPEEDPYVSIGSIVDPQSIVCIVEAMKLFNEIEAEVNGEIVEILVQDGELVEYGQPLFRVKKK